MTVSKILLGAGVAVLAIAGAISTKANTKLTTYYFISNGVCTSEDLATQCSGLGTGCTDGIHQLYQSIDSQGNCQGELKP